MKIARTLPLLLAALVLSAADEGDAERGPRLLKTKVEGPGPVHEAGREEVDAAVKAARKALTGEWGEMSQEKRLALLYKLADGINERFDEFLEAECLDTGKPYSLASHIDIPRGAANFKVFADVIKNVATESVKLITNHIHCGRKRPTTSGI